MSGKKVALERLQILNLPSRAKSIDTDIQELLSQGPAWQSALKNLAKIKSKAIHSTKLEAVNINGQLFSNLMTSGLKVLEEDARQSGSNLRADHFNPILSMLGPALNSAGNCKSFVDLVTPPMVPFDLVRSLMTMPAKQDLDLGLREATPFQNSLTLF